MHPYLSYDASRAHRRGCGDNAKILHFLLVTTRPIAHTGRCVYIQNYVGELVIDTGHLLVTSNGM